MAFGIGEDPARSVGAQLDSVDYPTTRESLVQAAEDNGASSDIINLLKALPREEYPSRELVLRDLGEASRRFGLMNFSQPDDEAIRDRRNIGRDAVEGAPPPFTRHP